MNIKRFFVWFAGWKYVVALFFSKEKLIDTSHPDVEYFHLVNELSIAIKQAESGDELAARRVIHLRRRMYTGFDGDTPPDPEEGPETKHWREYSTNAVAQAERWRHHCKNGSGSQ